MRLSALVAAVGLALTGAAVPAALHAQVYLIDPTNTNPISYWIFRGCIEDAACHTVTVNAQAHMRQPGFLDVWWFMESRYEVEGAFYRGQIEPNDWGLAPIHEFGYTNGEPWMDYARQGWQPRRIMVESFFPPPGTPPGDQADYWQWDVPRDFAVLTLTETNVTVVPEPSTFALSASALTLLGGLQLRRRRRR